jgi:uncharacterized cupredoxin-like copper-binding protein
MEGDMFRRASFVALVLLSVVAASCGGNDTGGTSASSASTPAEPPGTSGVVDATQKDFAIGLSPTTANSGPVEFQITNQGPSTHEFVVFKTDLAPDALPLNKDGDVDEEGPGVKHIDEVEDIASGATEQLKVSLQPGSYVVVCNLPGHYKLGMHAPLTIG